MSWMDVFLWLLDKRVWKLLGLVLLVVLVVCVLASDSSHKQIPNSGGNGKMSRGERECGRVLHQLFPGHVFRKVRPDWLPNDFPGRRTKMRNLELDWYCPTLRLAVEYNGQQHSKVVKKWNSHGLLSLQAQQARDAKKHAACVARGVTLIVVWYTVRHSHIESFLRTHPHIIALQKKLHGDHSR